MLADGPTGDRLAAMWRGFLIVLALALAVLAGVWALQRRLIYFPSQGLPDVPTGVEAVSYPTEDGLELEGWLVATAGDARGIVLVLPGNAGNRAARVPLGRALAERGYSALLVDYRGYGGNPGSPSEEGLQRDARAALSYLEGRNDVDTDRIVYFGESLGSGVAVRLAVEKPPAALILRSPFSSLAAVGSVHYPLLPVSLLLRDRFENVPAVGEVETPILVIAGSDDRIVPTRLSRDLFDAAEEPKHLITIEGAGHNDIALLTGAEMIDAIAEFLDPVLEDR